MYYEDHIYCYIGNVVISMNPFKDLPIYDDVSVAIFLSPPPPGACMLPRFGCAGIWHQILHSVKPTDSSSSSRRKALLSSLYA